LKLQRAFLECLLTCKKMAKEIWQDKLFNDFAGSGALFGGLPIL